METVSGRVRTAFRAGVFLSTDLFPSPYSRRDVATIDPFSDYSRCARSQAGRSAFPNKPIGLKACREVVSPHWTRLTQWNLGRDVRKHAVGGGLQRLESWNPQDQVEVERKHAEWSDVTAAMVATPWFAQADALVLKRRSPREWLRAIRRRA